MNVSARYVELEIKTKWALGLADAKARAKECEMVPVKQYKSISWNRAT
jgi:hypothetical protein